MTPWDYRVVKHRSEQYKEDWYGIHEAFYDEDKWKPHSVTAHPVEVVGETEKEVKETLELMLKACSRPVLNIEDFNKKDKQDGTL